MNKRIHAKLLRLAFTLGEVLIHSFTVATFVYMFLVLMLADYLTGKVCTL